MSIPFQLCESYIRSHAKHQGSRPAGEEPRAITVSRLEGSRCHAICRTLCSRLNEQKRKNQPQWTLFDDTLLRQVLRDHDLPQHLEQYFPEDHIPEIRSLLGEILNLRPSTWELFEKTCQTILRLAQMGNVIVVGRGANVLCAQMPGVLHVRLIGAPTVRTRHIAASRGLDLKTAKSILQREDHARAHYFSEHFNREINDPNLYDMILSTDRIDDTAAAGLIAQRFHAQIIPTGGTFIAQPGGPRSPADSKT